MKYDAFPSGCKRNIVNLSSTKDFCCKQSVVYSTGEKYIAEEWS